MLTTHLVAVSPTLLVSSSAPKADQETDIMTLYSNYPWGDLWAEAELLEVLKYLRGSKRLRMPESWRGTFPTTLPFEDPTDSECGF